MILTLTYVVEIMILSNLEQILTFAHCSLKSLLKKNSFKKNVVLKQRICVCKTENILLCIIDTFSIFFYTDFYINFFYIDRSLNLTF